MRNLGDIITMCKENEKPEYEELRYSVLALSALLYFDHKDVRDFDKSKPDYIIKLKKEESFKRYHNALNKSPKEFIGWEHDPENPEYQRRLAIGNKLLDKIIARTKDGER